MKPILGTGINHLVSHTKQPIGAPYEAHSWHLHGNHNGVLPSATRIEPFDHYLALRWPQPTRDTASMRVLPELIYLLNLPHSILPSPACYCHYPPRDCLYPFRLGHNFYRLSVTPHPVSQRNHTRQDQQKTRDNKEPIPAPLSQNCGSKRCH